MADRDIPGFGEPTQYTFCSLPESNVNYTAYSVLVEYRGEGLWAVLRSRWCLGVDGEWDYEPGPSSREDDWLETHRFDLETALRLAREAAPEVTVNGYTVVAQLEPDDDLPA